jgi:general secretion pathway protein G
VSAMVIYRPVRCARTLNQSVLSLSMREMHRAFTVVLLFTMVCGNVACSRREQLRTEAALRESLGVLRRGIRQFTLDHERPPTSLSELESSGYFNRIPADPFTDRNDTWRTKNSQGGEYFEVRSGSDATSSNGTRYSTW